MKAVVFLDVPTVAVLLHEYCNWLAQRSVTDVQLAGQVLDGVSRPAHTQPIRIRPREREHSNGLSKLPSIKHPSDPKPASHAHIRAHNRLDASGTLDTIGTNKQTPLAGHWSLALTTTTMPDNDEATPFYHDPRDPACLLSSAATKRKKALKHFNFFLDIYCNQIKVPVDGIDAIPYHGLSQPVDSRKTCAGAA